MFNLGKYLEMNDDADNISMRRVYQEKFPTKYIVHTLKKLGLVNYDGTYYFNHP